MGTTKKIDHNSSTNQRIKEKFVGIHVRINVNQLIEFILSATMSHNFKDAPFTFEDIENYYAYPEYYGTYARFEGGTEEQRDAEIERLEELFEADGTETDQLQSEINDLNDLETEGAEIFEWWAISSYLAEKLKENGYCILSDGNNEYWGRTTSGQAILLDSIISKICSDMEILDGQANSWA
jgi:hypothetical protein